jgi:hypothetical protein
MGDGMGGKVVDGKAGWRKETNRVNRPDRAGG